jgi:hypothetical protein
MPAGATEVTLTYHLGEGASATEGVELEHVATGFGARLYLQCPGQGCSRRVMALYLVAGLSLPALSWSGPTRVSSKM